MGDIELAIKIDEEIYKARQRWVANQKRMVDEVDIAIANGTPLPEEHGDLIDKGKFKKWIEIQDGDKLMTEYYLDALDTQEVIVGGAHNGNID